ncbi:MAG: hypothetical protein RR821_11590, partial [Clostridia bacterium]
MTTQKQMIKKGACVGIFLVILVLLNFMITCAAIGETADTWEEYAQGMRTLEENIGLYVDWPVTEKEQLIRSLTDMGYIRESSVTAELFEASMSEENKHQLADQIMLRFLGGDGNALVRKDGVRAIRWETITDVVMGSPSTWTLKERVWYQQLTNMFGHEDPDILVLPNSDDLSEKEAVAIARAAIVNAYGLANDALDCFIPDADLYITNGNSGYRRWRVNFLFYRYGQENGRTEVESYAAIVDPNGHVIADIELDEPHVRELALNMKTWSEDETSTIVQAFREYAERAHTYFPWQWSAETKAEYSRQIRSQVLSSLKKGNLAALSTLAFEGKPIQEIIDSTVYAYGLPEKKNLQETDAYHLAHKVLMDKYDLSDEKMEQFVVYSSFDITNPASPLWKFLFCPKSFQNLETVLLYKVELNANTKEVTATHTIDWDHLFQKQAYDLLLY